MLHSLTVLLNLGKKHQNAFQLLVDQAKKGYKKTGRVSQAAAMRTDEPAETLPSMRTDEPAETLPSMRTDEPAETLPLMRADEPAETLPSECIGKTYYKSGGFLLYSLTHCVYMCAYTRVHVRKL
jgi:hypothetical protein